MLQNRRGFINRKIFTRTAVVDAEPRNDARNALCRDELSTRAMGGGASAVEDECRGGPS